MFECSITVGPQLNLQYALTLAYGSVHFTINFYTELQAQVKSYRISYTYSIIHYLPYLWSNTTIDNIFTTKRSGGRVYYLWPVEATS